MCQKDVDARWAKKGDETHFGYKLHAIVSAANLHDSNLCTELLDGQRDRTLYADNAYQSTAILEAVKAMGIEPRITGQRLESLR